MAEQPEKNNIQELAHAINRSYGSGWWTVWRGFLFGLGKGLGTIIVWGIVLTILFNILQSAGVIDALAQNIQTFTEIRDLFRQ